MMLKPILILVLSNLALCNADILLCPSGCYCPSEEVVHCCLFSSEHPSPVQCHLEGRRQISANLNSTFRWPSMDTCLARWTNLSVQLSPNSWPPATPKRPCMAQLHRISISGESLITLKAQHFQALFGLQENHLKVLIIENTPLENLEPGLFDRLSLKALTEIHLKQNYNLSYKGFGVSVFSSLPQLETLNLEGNRIERLDFVRWGFPTINKDNSPSRLISLNLANNSLTYVKPGTFSLFPFMETLSLANNKLSSLSSDIFEGLTSLKHLDLSGNLLNLLGLKNSVPDFSIALANLNLLDISMNPLMRSIYTSTAKWWLSSGCPASLTHLLMNHIDMDQGQELPILPLINWERCQKLARIEIQQIPRLSCLPAAWLQSDVLPMHPQLITSATRVCIPSSTAITSTTATSTSFKITTDRSKVASVTESEHFGLRELIVSSVVGAVIFILIVLLIVIVFVCRRRRWMYESVAKENGNSRVGIVKNGRGELPVTSTYIPVSDCQLPIEENDDSQLSLSSMRQMESRVLYDEKGAPVCSLVVPETGSPTNIMFSDGTIAYVPQFIPISGRATPPRQTGMLDKSHRNSCILLRHPIMVPLMTSHTSLATSQIDFPHQQHRTPLSCQHLSKARVRLPNHPHRHSRNSNHAHTSTLSCKSTSFSSLASMHSEIPPYSNGFSASPPPLATVIQVTKPSSPPSSPSAASIEKASLIFRTGVDAAACPTNSTANHQPVS